jgi:hypothetical protein
LLPAGVLKTEEQTGTRHSWLHFWRLQICGLTFLHGSAK